MRQFSKEQTDKLFQISGELLELFNYFDDKDCELHSDDFIATVMDEIVSVMENIKDSYYELNPHRIHQRV